MATVKVEPIILFVSRFDECVAFYRDVLGLRVKSTDRVHESFVEFDLHGATFALRGGYKGKSHDTGPIAVHFEVEDIHDTVEILRTAGAEVEDPKRWEDLGLVEATFKDPDGNEFDLIQSL